LKYNLYYFAPLKHGITVLGFVNKYNAPATIERYVIAAKQVNITLKDAGRLAVYLPARPKEIKVGNKFRKELNLTMAC
jgi:hypothetical protein